MINSESELIDDQFLFVRKELVNSYQLKSKENDLIKKISHFKCEFKSRWNEVHDIEERFFKVN